MSYFQKHLKATVEHAEAPFPQARLFQPSQSAINASKFKKNAAKTRISQSHTVQETVRTNKPREINESALSQVSQRQNKGKREDSKPVKDRSENRNKQEVKAVRPRAGQFATKNNHMDSESMNRGLVNMLAQADNSMQQLLNSSINQFQRYLQDKDSIYEQHNQLMEQNQHLKASLDQLKTILKDKLESALHKQKEELTLMMEDYIRLITKLLSDKEELTANIEQLQYKLNESNTKHQSFQKELAQSRSKIEELTKSNEQHIMKTKVQIEDFLQVIDQYQEEAEQEGKENLMMKQQIEELTFKLKKYEENPSPRLQKQNSQSSKTQTLIELLEKSQQQNRYLREALRKAQKNDDHYRRLQEEYNQKLQQFEQEHEQQFMEYDKAVKETMSKKDQCIQRLNSIIEGYKQRRMKENSFDNSMEMIADHYN